MRSKHPTLPNATAKMRFVGFLSGQNGLAAINPTQLQSPPDVSFVSTPLQADHDIDAERTIAGRGQLWVI